MHIILFLLVNFVVLLSAYFLSSRLLKPASAADSLIQLLLLYFSLIVLEELFLGCFGILTFLNIVGLSLVICLLVSFITGRNKKAPRSFRLDGFWIKSLLNENVSLFLISAVICYAIVKLFVNLVNPPSGWDSINYHFTFAVEWLKHANLTMPPTVFDDPSPTYYPINGSLFYLWFIMPLRNVFLADLGQVPFYIL